MRHSKIVPTEDSSEADVVTKVLNASLYFQRREKISRSDGEKARYIFRYRSSSTSLEWCGSRNLQKQSDASEQKADLLHFLGIFQKSENVYCPNQFFTLRSRPFCFFLSNIFWFLRVCIVSTRVLDPAIVISLRYSNRFADYDFSSRNSQSSFIVSSKNVCGARKNVRTTGICSFL